MNTEIEVMTEKVSLAEMNLSEDQYSVLCALMNRQDRPDYVGQWFDVSCSQYNGSHNCSAFSDFISFASPAALRGLAKRGLIQHNHGWRSARIRALVEFVS